MQGSYLAYNYKKVKFFKTNKLSGTGIGSEFSLFPKILTARLFLK